MGSRILVMGANPGHVKYDIKNELRYPRDEKSNEFKSLVEKIHDILTESIIPDIAELIPSHRGPKAMEFIPPVNLIEIIGLLELMEKEGGSMDAFELAQELMRESVHVLVMARAAEILDLVETPKDLIVVTDLGRRLVKGDINTRKKMIHEQLLKLNLTQALFQYLEKHDGTVTRDDAEQVIYEWLPNEDPAEILDTVIQWGRFGELFGYSDDTKMVYIDRGES